MTHLKIAFNDNHEAGDEDNTSTVEAEFDDVKAAVLWLLDHLGYWCLDEDVTVSIDGERFVW